MKTQGRSSLIEQTRGRESDVPWGIRLLDGTAIISVPQGRQLVIRSHLNVTLTTFCHSRLQQHSRATSMTSWNIAKRVIWILTLFLKGYWRFCFLRPWYRYKRFRITPFWDALIGSVYLRGLRHHEWNKLGMIQLLSKNTPCICTFLERNFRIVSDTINFLYFFYHINRYWNVYKEIAG